MNSPIEKNIHLARTFTKQFMYIYLFVSVCFCIYVLIEIDMAWKSNGWSTTTGEILSSKTVRSVRSIKPEIKYRFRVDEKEYTGDRILMGPGPVGSGMGLPSPRDYVAKYSKGKEIQVYFNPGNPKRSVLEPGINRVLTLFLFAGSFILLLGLFMYRQLYRKEAKDMTEAGPTVIDATEPGNHQSAWQPKTEFIHLDATSRLIGFLAFFAFLCVAGHLFWPKYLPWLEKSGIVKITRTHNTTGNTETTPVPLMPEQSRHQKLPVDQIGNNQQHAAAKNQDKVIRSDRKKYPNAIPVTVAITKDFSPITTDTIGSVWNPLTSQLTSEKPKEIIREPLYHSDSQKYGHLELGTQKNKTYYFVLDQLDAPHPVMFLDKNQNGDLSDDGEPYHNQGSGRFATEINLPIAQLIKELDIQDNLALWFFINDYSWEKGFVNCYSRTQMKGQVIINGKQYPAYIAEWKFNDADFTNDGIYIDLNSNGKIDRKTEFIKPDCVARINGSDYWFEVQW